MSIYINPEYIKVASVGTLVLGFGLLLNKLSNYRIHQCMPKIVGIIFTKNVVDPKILKYYSLQQQKQQQHNNNTTTQQQQQEQLRDRAQN